MADERFIGEQEDTNPGTPLRKLQRLYRVLLEHLDGLFKRVGSIEASNANLQERVAKLEVTNAEREEPNE